MRMNICVHIGKHGNIGYREWIVIDRMHASQRLCDDDDEDDDDELDGRFFKLQSFRAMNILCMQHRVILLAL
jgi:hypothetical protein